MARPTNARSDFAIAMGFLVALAPAASSQDRKATAGQQDASAARTIEIGTLKLALPAGWQERRPGARLRLTQFSFDQRHTRANAVKFAAEIPGNAELPRGSHAELAIFHFGPNGAGNVRRVVRGWIGQFARSSWKGVETDPRVEIRGGERTGGSYTLVDAAGTYIYDMGPFFRFEARLMPRMRMLAAVLTSPEGPYYVKLTGPERIVATTEQAFRELFGGNAQNELQLEADLRPRPAVVRVRFELDGKSYSAAGVRVTLGGAVAVCTDGGAVFENVDSGKHELSIEQIEGCKPVLAREVTAVSGRIVEVVVQLEPRDQAAISKRNPHLAPIVTQPFARAQIDAIAASPARR